MGGYFLYEYILNCCLVSYSLRSNVMSRKSTTFFGFNSDLQVVVFEDFSHFFFDRFNLLGRFCAGG